MSRVLVEPASSKPRLSDIVNIEGSSSENHVLSCLRVCNIQVSQEDSSWTISLEVDDKTRWKKIISDITKTDFDLILASSGQELRKMVEGLMQVYWQLPSEFSSGFKSVDQTPPSENGDSKQKRYIRTTSKPLDSSQAVALTDLTGGEKGRVVVCGTVVSINWRQNKVGKMDATLIITDRLDSLRIRLTSWDEVDESIHPGIFIVARGRMALDRFDEEPVLFVSQGQIQESAPQHRQDNYREKRVELHLHSKMSQLDSVVDLKKLFERAASWGHPAVAITDHGVVQAFPEAYSLAKKHGLRLIYGVEGYLVEDDDVKGRSYHIVILVKNRKGLRNLYEIVTKSHLKYFYRRPRIPRNLLESKREGLIIGSACEAGEVFKAVLDGKEEDELRRIAAFYDYLEIQPLDNNFFLVEHGTVPDIESLKKLNRKVYYLAKELDKPCVMTCDCHYVDPEDEIFRTILLSGKGMNSGETPAKVYFRTTDEMIEEASEYLGEEVAYEVVVKNTRAIADLVDDLAPVPEGSYFPSLPQADVILRQLAEDGAKKIYGNTLPEIVSERLERELQAIIGNGFSSLYLIAIRMVEKSLKDGYLVGSRGSVGSSLVATCTGITEVNPLPPHYICPNCHYSDFTSGQSLGSGFDLPRKSCPDCGTDLNRDGQDIPFETFMGFKGEKVPDIDLNFSGEEQGEMFKFAAELLGKDNVFRAGTIGTIATKTAFGFVKHYSQERGLVLRKAHETTLCSGLEGVKRTTGQHPGGVMVVPDGMDILDFTPLQYPADDRKAEAVTTHFDYNSISGHLVKVDILGHDDPTVLKMLHDLTGIDPTTVPMDDPATLSLFAGENMSDAVGIPEFGTRFVRQMLTETHPSSFADLVRISGLSHGTDVWANNARDLIKEGIVTLKDVIATREDIFLYLPKKGIDEATAFAIAEKVRKGKPLSPEDIQIMKEAKVPQWYIDSCKKISYLFPKAHAVAYVTTAFRIAYFKVHHPVAFGAAYFSFHGSSISTDIMYLTEKEWRDYIDRVTSSSNSKSKEQDIAATLEVALELSKRGITFAKPSLYKSQASKYVPEGNALIPPFVAIPGLGMKAAEAIVTARDQGVFSSIDDFRRRTGIGKKLCESLKDTGLFEGLPDSEQLSLFSI